LGRKGKKKRRAIRFPFYLREVFLLLEQGSESKEESEKQKRLPDPSKRGRRGGGRGNNSITPTEKTICFLVREKKRGE